MRVCLYKTQQKLHTNSNTSTHTKFRTYGSIARTKTHSDQSIVKTKLSKLKLTQLIGECKIKQTKVNGKNSTLHSEQSECRCVSFRSWWRDVFNFQFRYIFFLQPFIYKDLKISFQRGPHYHNNSAVYTGGCLYGNFVNDSLGGTRSIQ